MAESEADIRVPHFSVPFRFHTVSGKVQASVREQDTVEEIGDCVEAIVRCPTGHRIDSPEFGLDDLTFTGGPFDLEIIKGDIIRWEPRAKMSILDDIDEADALKRRLNIIVQTPPEVVREEVEGNG
jgi:phage baseplate assembly protein W